VNTKKRVKRIRKWRGWAGVSNDVIEVESGFRGILSIWDEDYLDEAKKHYECVVPVEIREVRR